MRLALFNHDAESFVGQGLGVLEDVMNDEVHEVLNGQFELTLQYPVTGRLFSGITIGRYITARPNAVATPQPFRIYRVTKARNGWVTVHARHIAYRLQTVICKPFHADGVEETLWYLNTNTAPETPFQFYSDIQKDVPVNLFSPMSVWSFMGSEQMMLRWYFGGEWMFNGHSVYLQSARGKDRGVQILYGSNLRDLEFQRQAGEGINGIFAYCMDEDGITMLDSAVVMSNLYAEGEQKRLIARDYSQWMDIDSDLQSWAQGDIAMEKIGYDDSVNTMKIDFVQLSRTEEYRDKALPDVIDIGDLIAVKDWTLGVRERMRVTEIRYQPSQRKYKQIVLGTPARTIVNTILNK